MQLNKLIKEKTLYYKICVYFLFFTIFLRFGYSETLKSYIGFVYSDYPEKIKRYHGILIPDSMKKYNYSLSLVTDGSLYRIWFEQEVDRKVTNERNIAIFKVIDEVVIMTYFEGDVIFLNNNYYMSSDENSGLCGYNKNRDIEIIGYFNIKDKGNNDPDHINKNIKRAWKANKKTNKLEELNTKGLVCDRPVYSSL
jgi:hypothetical protein